MHADDDRRRDGADDQTRRPAARGRPQRFVPPRKLAHLPLDQSLRELSPTAQSLLAAGRKLLEEKGFRALTLEAVAFEAGTSKSTLVEQFGNRAAFLAILFDSLMQDETASLVREKGVPFERDDAGRVDSVEATIGSLAALYENVETNRAYFEILAMAMHDEALRRRLADLQRWYRQLRLNILSTSAAADVCTEEELGLLATLVEAAESGLSLDRAVDPQTSDLQAEMEMLGRLVSAFIDKKAREQDQPS